MHPKKSLGFEWWVVKLSYEMWWLWLIARYSHTSENFQLTICWTQQRLRFLVGSSARGIAIENMDPQNLLQLEKLSDDLVIFQMISTQTNPAPRKTYVQRMKVGQKVFPLTCSL